MRYEAPAAGVVAARCLGPFELLAGARALGDWRPGGAPRLLQYLLLHHDRFVPRATLVEALWPDPEAAAAGTSLKVAIHALRRLLERLPETAGRLEVQRLEGGYRLHTAGLWLDVEAFEQECAQGRRLEWQGRTAQALEAYAGAAALYRGDLLEESAEEWPLLRREGLKDEYLHVVARLADAAYAAGDVEGCIRRCRELLERDRCREDAYRMLMQCYARLGQRGRVQRWFQLCAHTLEKELEVAPAPETVALYRAALDGRTEAGPPGSPGLSGPAGLPPVRPEAPTAPGLWPG